MTRWCQGDINLVVNREKEGFAHSFNLVHGSAVCALGLAVDECGRRPSSAPPCCSTQPFHQAVGPGELDIPAVRGVGGSLIYFLDQTSDARPRLGHRVRADRRGRRQRGRPDAVDHISQSMQYEEMLSWLLFYTSLLDLEKVPPQEVADPGGLVRSQVIEAADGSVRFVLNASQSQRTQSSRFLQRAVRLGRAAHRASPPTTCWRPSRSSKRNGVRLLAIPENYYDDLEAKTDLPPEQLDGAAGAQHPLRPRGRRGVPAGLYRDLRPAFLLRDRPAPRLSRLWRRQRTGPAGGAGAAVDRHAVTRPRPPSPGGNSHVRPTEPAAPRSGDRRPAAQMAGERHPRPLHRRQRAGQPRAGALHPRVPLSRPTLPTGTLERFSIPGPNGQILVERVPPAEGAPIGTLVFFHGGGFIIGDIDSHQAHAIRLANRARVVVLNVDYRLAPEHPFPQGVEDALAAMRWAAANLARLGGAARPLAVGGDSAGGNFAAVAAICCRDEGLPLAAQLLLYPVTDLHRGGDPDIHRAYFGDGAASLAARFQGVAGPRPAAGRGAGHHRRRRARLPPSGQRHLRRRPARRRASP